MLNLQIQSNSANVIYNSEIIPLCIFVRRLTWLNIPNTSEPAIEVQVSDQHYVYPCEDPTYKFMLFLLDNLKHNFYLKQPEYSECLQKMLHLSEAYASSPQRRIATRGKIVDYKMTSWESNLLSVVYENGDIERTLLTRFLDNSDVDVYPEEVVQFSRDMSQFRDMRCRSAVSIVLFELDGVSGNVKCTLSNGDVRLYSPKLFMIVQHTSIFPSNRIDQFQSVDILLSRLRNGYYDIRVNPDGSLLALQTTGERILQRIRFELTKCRTESDIDILLKDVPEYYLRRGKTDLRTVISGLVAARLGGVGYVGGNKKYNAYLRVAYSITLSHFFLSNNDALFINGDRMKRAGMHFMGSSYRMPSRDYAVKFARKGQKEYLYNSYLNFMKMSSDNLRSSYYIRNVSVPVDSDSISDTYRETEDADSVLSLGTGLAKTYELILTRSELDELLSSGGYYGKMISSYQDPSQRISDILYEKYMSESELFFNGLMGGVSVGVGGTDSSNCDSTATGAVADTAQDVNVVLSEPLEQPFVSSYSTLTS